MIFPAKKRKHSKSSFPDMRLDGERIYLRPPKMSDAKSWAEIRRRCRSHLQPFEPRWSMESLSAEQFEKRLDRQMREWLRGLSQSFLIFHQSDDHLIGGMNINNIYRGAAQYAALGYWLDEALQGRGLMAEAMDLTLKHCFTTLKLHRVNAATLEHNTRSRNLLGKAGFVEEGFAKHYLQIDGQWQDHVLYGLPLEFWKIRSADQKSEKPAQEIRAVRKKI